MSMYFRSGGFIIMCLWNRRIAITRSLCRPYETYEQVSGEIKRIQPKSDELKPIEAKFEAKYILSGYENH